MPLPTLDKLQIAQPQPATMKLQAMKLGDHLQRTDIAQKNVGLREMEYKDVSKHRKAIEMIRAHDIAFKNGSNSEEVNSILKNLGYEGNVKVGENTIEDMEVLGADGKKYKVTGPKSVVLETIDAISREPKYFNDPKTGQYLKSQGVILRPVEGEKGKKDSDFTLSEGQVRYDSEGNVVVRGPAKRETEKEKTKKLESLKSDFMQQIGRGYSAERGVGQFVPDENKAEVAKKAYDSAMVIAQTYVNEGGKWEDLGLNPPGEETPKDEMMEMPPPTEHKDKIIRDTQTGKRYKSDGKEWVEIE